jgi:RHS repeat-associated protein
VIEQNWYDPTTSSSVVDLTYSYDDDGNVLYRNDAVNTAFGELPPYDGLGQITSFERGTLNSGHTAITGTPSVDETWTYDPLGNHTSDTVGSTTTTENANYQNEITSISGATTPVYDNDGNMTTDQSGLKYVYNAWGEVVTVKNSGGTTLETYSYDGLGDRMTNTVGSTTTDLYYSTADQVLEEYLGSKYTTRYVWSPVYVNEMIFRDTDTSGTGLTATGTSYQRLFALQDANYNVVALVNSSGSVLERYVYDPFGAVTVLTGSYGSRSSSSYSWIYGFQGGRQDTITGDTHFGARNEDPGTGTWTSMDPLGFAAGDDDLYGLELNEPTCYTDPSGLSILITAIGFAAYCQIQQQVQLHRTNGIGVQAPDLTRTTVVSDGKGGISVQIGTANDPLAPRILIDAQVAHEKVHIKDLLKRFPKAGIGLPPDCPIHFFGPTRQDSITTVQSEVDGSNAEIVFLQDALKNEKNQGAISWITQRIDQITKSRERYTKQLAELNGK